MTRILIFEAGETRPLGWVEYRRGVGITASEPAYKALANQAMELGATPRQAVESLDGWSNGYALARAETDAERKMRAVRTRAGLVE